MREKGRAHVDTHQGPLLSLPKFIEIHKHYYSIAILPLFFTYRNVLCIDRILTTSSLLNYLTYPLIRRGTYLNSRVRLANRGRLLLRTPGPVPFGICICFNVETILSWTCHVYGPFEFRTSLGTSILLSTLFCLWQRLLLPSNLAIRTDSSPPVLSISMFFLVALLFACLQVSMTVPHSGLPRFLSYVHVRYNSMFLIWCFVLLSEFWFFQYCLFYSTRTPFPLQITDDFRWGKKAVIWLVNIVSHRCFLNF